MTDRGHVSDATRNEEQKDEGRASGPDSEPTGDQERAAKESARELEASNELDDVARHYDEMTKLGAHDKGEGRIP